MPDPLLTPYGEEQCRHLASRFHRHSSVSLVVASPLRRTIYTALLGFPDEFKRGLRLVALPEAQENTSTPCDTGSDLSVLEKEFEGKPVDLSLVKKGWNSKIGKWAPEPAALSARAKEVRQWLKACPEKEIVLVTHGGFLHYLTENWDDFIPARGTGWWNTEYRTYKFADESGDNATLVETGESRQSRRSGDKQLTESEKLTLVRTRSADSNSNVVIPSKV